VFRVAGFNVQNSLIRGANPDEVLILEYQAVAICKLFRSRPIQQQLCTQIIRQPDTTTVAIRKGERQCRYFAPYRPVANPANFDCPSHLGESPDGSPCNKSPFPAVSCLQCAPRQCIPPENHSQSVCLPYRR